MMHINFLFQCRKIHLFISLLLVLQNKSSFELKPCLYHPVHLAAPSLLLEDILATLTENAKKEVVDLVDQIYHYPDFLQILIMASPEKRDQELAKYFAIRLQKPVPIDPKTIKTIKKYSIVDFYMDTYFDILIVKFFHQGYALCVLFTAPKTKFPRQLDFLNSLKTSGQFGIEKHHYVFLEWSKAMQILAEAKTPTSRPTAKQTPPTKLVKPAPILAASSSPAANKVPLAQPPYGRAVSIKKKEEVYTLIQSGFEKAKRERTSGEANASLPCYPYIAMQLAGQNFYFRVYKEEEEGSDWYWFLDSQGHTFIVRVDEAGVRDATPEEAQRVSESIEEVYRTLELILGRNLLQVYAKSQRNPFSRLKYLAKWLKDKGLQDIKTAQPYVLLALASVPRQRKGYYDTYLQEKVPAELALQMALRENFHVVHSIFTFSRSREMLPIEAALISLSSSPATRLNMFDHLRQAGFPYEEALAQVLTLSDQEVESRWQEISAAQIRKTPPKGVKIEIVKEEEKKTPPVPISRPEVLADFDEDTPGLVWIHGVQIFVAKSSHVDDKKLIRQYRREIIKQISKFLRNPDAPTYQQRLATKKIYRIHMGSQRLYLRYYREEKAVVIVAFTSTGDSHDGNTLLPQFREYLLLAAELPFDTKDLYALSRDITGRLQVVSEREPEDALITEAGHTPTSFSLKAISQQNSFEVAL